YGKIVVELKVCRGLAPEHIAQALNYLSALKFDLALLVNFGTPKLQWKRVILSQESIPSS
ncbi:MAG: GxxExxY protein, partial [Candidatus Cloacimonetes bacterium]|nr:GxxExxY protein [Candidatus Cloacimonadota bacterium]